MNEVNPFNDFDFEIVIGSAADASTDVTPNPNPWWVVVEFSPVDSRVMNGYTTQLEPWVGDWEIDRKVFGPFYNGSEAESVLDDWLAD